MTTRLQRVAMLDQDIDARHRTALVTGATDGIGYCLARRLASRGARVVVAARDARKSAAVIRELMEQTGSEAVEGVPLDLSDLSSVRAAVVSCRARFEHVDILVCNAGANLTGTRERAETTDGFEWTVGVNHFGHAAHPGAVDTRMLRRYFERPLLRWLLEPTRRIALVTPDQAAGGLERIALDPALVASPGQYFERGFPAKASPAGRDDELAGRLWDLTLARLEGEI